MWWLGQYFHKIFKLKSINEVNKLIHWKKMSNIQNVLCMLKSISNSLYARKKFYDFEYFRCERKENVKEQMQRMVKTKVAYQTIYSTLSQSISKSWYLYIYYAYKVRMLPQVNRGFIVYSRTAEERTKKNSSSAHIEFYYSIAVWLL